MNARGRFRRSFTPGGVRYLTVPAANAILRRSRPHSAGLGTALWHAAPRSHFQCRSDSSRAPGRGGGRNVSGQVRAARSDDACASLKSMPPGRGRLFVFMSLRGSDGSDTININHSKISGTSSSTAATTVSREIIEAHVRGLDGHDTTPANNTLKTAFLKIFADRSPSPSAAASVQARISTVHAEGDGWQRHRHRGRPQRRHYGLPARRRPARPGVGTLDLHFDESNPH